ncbi:unnamed protein product [Hymenolepis diminuta]|uniref:C-type lectin domain-containing protein n=1 Tax=Hymenolepis diminuta TaxID=6216 RepID=A0A0R3SIY7_HYMDI|nr:unnamed protein product [Hymenolepis diminuta]VUZ53847.1 unnamed protein product [Hymenolepis diminuta]
MECSRVVLIFLAVQSIRSDSTHDYTVEGADYVVRIGYFNYAVYAMIAVNHARAIALCNALYPGGRLAWMGDMKFRPVAKVIYKLMIFHYMSLNNYFWIDGDLDDPHCDPEQSSCIWIASNSSLIESEAKASFENTDVMFHKPRKKPEKFWPVLVPNRFNEYNMRGDAFLSAAPEKEKAGFICAYKEKRNKCPIGFSLVNMRIPSHMTTFNVTKPDVCNSTLGE